MRDDRYTRGPAPYDANAQGYAGDEYQTEYGDARPSGFVRHQSGNSRSISKENPVVGAAKQLGGAVSGLVQNIRQGRTVNAVPQRASRAAAMGEGGDYLGVGDPCRICGNPVDAGQTRCPHCGAFVHPLYTNVVFWISTAFLVVLVVLFTLAINSCKPVDSGNTPDNTNTPGASTVDPASREAALSAALTSAQNILDTQTANRSSTRYSLNNLQSVVTSATAVLENKDSTDEQLAQAAQSVSDAIAGLVTTVNVNYPWPWYFEELLADPAGWTGRQLAVNGTCQVITVNADGTITAAMAVSGDTNCIIYVTYWPSDASAELSVGRDFNAYGVMTGLTNGAPSVLADWIEVL